MALPGVFFCEEYLMSEQNFPELIASKIFFLRGQKVMFDSDLAELYGVETKVLNQAVKRNAERFPDDFAFIPTINELRILRSQFVTSKPLTYWNNMLRHPPTVFTEYGIAMLSGVLNSRRAIEVNIAIMRIFMKLRSFLLLEKNLTDRMNTLETGTNQMFKTVFERMDSLERDFDEVVKPKVSEKKRKIGLGEK